MPPVHFTGGILCYHGGGKKTDMWVRRIDSGVEMKNGILSR